MALKKQRDSIIVLSDDDEISINSSNVYYNKELKIYIDLEQSSEWTVIDFHFNIEYTFKKLKEKYFGEQNINPDYEIHFDSNHIIPDGSAFRILQRSKKIVVSQNMLTRPRIQQLSIVMHILIHLFLNHVSRGTISVTTHDQNFREIMNSLNLIVDMKINANHKFEYVQGQEDYAKQWYMCTGVCQHYHPFKGIYRSTIAPNETMLFWKLHHKKCAGTFFRIFEIQKTNSLDELDKKYVRSPCYQNPKSIQSCPPAASKNPIREKIDLTSDIGSPIVQNLCDVIDLDESQYNNEECDTQYFRLFTSNYDGNLCCPFCMQFVGSNGFAAHVDVCMGYQSQVSHGIKPNNVVPFIPILFRKK